MDKKKKLVLTGGGTAGHVMPHIALLPPFAREGWQLFYIGSGGIEQEIMAGTGIPFRTIQAGKLRRYFSWQNFIDIFRVVIGFVQAAGYLAAIRPALVFSKGGFVSVPVCLAARVLRIPVVSHESDLTPGLANRIIGRFARLILYAFPQTGSYLGNTPSRLVGLPVRDSLLRGNAARGRAFCGFPANEQRPVYLVMGGSLGAQKINEALAGILPDLVRDRGVIHITGKGKGIAFEHPWYRAFEYVQDELPDLFAAADYVVSRAGANSIFEFLALQKPMLLIPLEAGSRGDQVHNARSFVENDWAKVLREKDLSGPALQQAMMALEKDAAGLQNRLREAGQRHASEEVVQSLRELMA